MSKCKCNFTQKTVGDGCEVCNPAKALEYAVERYEEAEALAREAGEALVSIRDHQEAVGGPIAKLGGIHRISSDAITKLRAAGLLGGE